MASFTADPPAPSAPRTPPEAAIPESPIPDFPGPASASAIPTPGLKPVAPPPDLGRRIRARSWALVLDAFANATGAARRAPGMASSRGLAVLRKLAIIDPARVLGLAKAARALAPRSAFVTETEAMMTARALGWDAAAPLFAGLRPEARNGAAAALLRHRPAPAIWPALPAAHRPAALTEAEARSLVIYTVAFGEGPEPAPLFYGVPGLRFLCLTDRTDLAIAGWETVAPPASPGTPADPAAARSCRCRRRRDRVAGRGRRRRGPGQGRAPRGPPPWSRPARARRRSDAPRRGPASRSRPPSARRRDHAATASAA